MTAEIDKFRLFEEEDGGVTNPRGPVLGVHVGDLKTQIEADGIIDPLLVREIDGFLYVIDGHRRLKAAQIIGLPELPYVLDTSERDPLALMLAANVREEVPLLVLDDAGKPVGGMALAVKRFLARGGTARDLAKSLGDDKNNVSAMADMPDAPLGVRLKIAEGKMSVTAFARIRYAPEDVQKEIVEEAGDGAVTVRAARRKAKRAREQEPDVDAPTGAREQEPDAGALADAQRALNIAQALDVTAMLTEMSAALRELPDELDPVQVNELARVASLASQRLKSAGANVTFMIN